ncbi:MAG: hypothetical protein IPN53_13520 [Comamonadaceae bacterium]|nr:hypothetical protein [Comamonadaceae bacterium]
MVAPDHDCPYGPKLRLLQQANKLLGKAFIHLNQSISMPNDSELQVNAKVRFTHERLSVLMAHDRRRLEGRVGTVQGRWQGTRKLTVYFPQDGSRAELRILQIDPRHIELVEQPPVAEELPSPLIDKAPSDQKMSQEELDKLFG